MMLVLSQQPGLNIITELIIGYLYPGKPLANVVFKTYGYISMAQALTFLADFKLGHYMKIPPRSMFFAQVMKLRSNQLSYFTHVVRRAKRAKLFVSRHHRRVFLSSWWAR